MRFRSAALARAGRVYIEPMTTTRAFFKGTRLGRDKLVVVVGRPRSLVIERGMLFGAKKRIKVTRALSSADESQRAFERECAARLQDGWAEIRALIEEQYFDPPVGAMIDPGLQRALIDTARGAPLPKATKAPQKATAPVGSRGAVLTELVSRGKRVRLEGRLVLPTGRIVAADPMLLSEAPPFERTIAPGAYPVVLSTKASPEKSFPVRLQNGCWYSSRPRSAP